MEIQNSAVGRIAREEAKLTLAEGYPNNLLPNVVAVMDVSPSFHPNIISKNGGTFSSGATNTIFTSDANKTTKIYGFQYSIQKDSTCDVASGFASAKVNIGGSSNTIASVPIQTLTAQAINISIFFQRPIQIDKNAAFTITQGTFTVGVFARVITVYVSEED